MFRVSLAHHQGLWLYKTITSAYYQDRDRWRALVSMVRNLRVPKMRDIPSLSLNGYHGLFLHG